MHSRSQHPDRTSSFSSYDQSVSQSIQSFITENSQNSQQLSHQNKEGSEHALSTWFVKWKKEVS